MDGVALDAISQQRLERSTVHHIANAEEPHGPLAVEFALKMLNFPEAAFV